MKKTLQVLLVGVFLTACSSVSEKTLPVQEVVDTKLLLEDKTFEEQESIALNQKEIKPVKNVVKTPPPSLSVKRQKTVVKNKPKKEVKVVVKPAKDVTKKDDVDILLKPAVTEAVSSKEVSIPSTINISLDNLPLKLADGWALDQRLERNSGKQKCMILSKPKSFYDGYDNSKIKITILMDSLLIRSDSNIDLSYQNSGIVIGNNSLIKFDKLLTENVVNVKQGFDQLKTQLKNSEKLTVKLGFWPTWPKTQLQNINFKFIDFSQAYQQLKQCDSL